MREGVTYKRLGDVCEIIMGQSPLGDSVNSIEGVEFHQGKISFEEKFLQPSGIYTTEPKKIAKAYSVLLCVRAPVGIVNITERDICIGRGLCAISGKKNMLTDYVFYALQFQREHFEKNSTGSTFKAISANIIQDTVVPVPSIDEQKRVVSELDCLVSIIADKQQQLRELDNLSQAIFYDMFGHPEINEKGFPLLKMDDVVIFQGGSQPDKSYFEYEPSAENVRLIQIRDYKTDKYVTYIPKSLAKKFCTADDIMIGRYGPPIFQILKGLEGAYNVALMKAIPKQGNKEFIRFFLKQDCLRMYLENFSQRVAGQDGIQMDKLKAYPFPFPPYNLQEQFEKKVKTIEEQKDMLKQSIAEFENLLAQRMELHFA